MVNAATQVGIIHFPMTDDSSSDPFVVLAPDVACDEQVSVTEYVAPAPDVTYTEPDPVIEHATLAPVDVYTTPAPVIEFMPAPVIEYFAPPPAVSYPSFFPSFDQINEAFTGLVNLHFSITADETSQMPVVVQEIPEVQVVERIQEQIVEPVEMPLQEHVHLHTAIQIVHVPVPQIQEIPLDHFPGLIAEQIVPGRIEEQIGDIPLPPIVEETVDLVLVLPHEHLPLAMEYIAPASPVTDSLPELGLAELSALESPQNVSHEKQMDVDRRVVVLEREKDKLPLLEECSFAPRRDLAELRRAIQAGQDALAVAMRDLHAFREQSGLRLKREADVKTAQRAECFSVSTAPSSPATKKAK